MRRFFAALLLFAGAAQAASHGTPWANTGSGLGTNLNFVSYFTAEQPFLNIFKTGVGWGTLNNGVGTGEGVLLYTSFLDANGYPTTLTGGVTHTFNQINTLLLNGIPSSDGGGGTYPAGHYVFLYDGTGTFSFSDDFSATPICGGSQTACSVGGTGRIVINVASPTIGGTFFTLLTTGAGAAYARNFRLVYGGCFQSPNPSCVVSDSSTIGTNETLLNNGEMFNPVFIQRISFFKTLRFMDWMATSGAIGNFQTNWSDRPGQGWAFWADSRTNATINGAEPRSSISGISDGVPAEIMFALCNEINADCWFNMPPLATTAYITNFATLAHSTLNSNIRVFVEYANELFNGSGPASCGVFGPQQSGSISAAPLNNNSVGVQIGHAGWALFPSLAGDIGQGCESYGAYMAIQSGTLWKAAWAADSSRVTTVWTGMNGNPAYAEFWLPLKSTNAGGPSTWGVGTPNPTGTLAQNVDALGVAPYFNYGTPDAWTADADGGLAKLFQEILPSSAGKNTNVIPTALDTGNCGGGAGLTCGGTTAYTFTTAQSVTCPPANGTLIAFQVNVSNAANPTLAVNGCGTPAPIQKNDGSLTGTALTGALATSTNFVAAYTSAVAGGAVSTPGWRVFLGGQLGVSTGMVGQIEGGTTSSAATAVSNSLRFISYEGGQQLLAGFGNGNDALLQTQYLAAQRDPRMYLVYEQFFAFWKASGGQTFIHFNDIAASNSAGFWGLLENVMNTNSPKYAAVLDFNRRNPCWWASCRH